MRNGEPVPCRRSAGGDRNSNTGAGVGAALAGRVAPDRHARKAGKLRREPLPDPQAKVFEARRFETADLVEHAVIELAAHGAASFFQLREIDDETSPALRLAAHPYLGLERMAMHAVVRVALR